MGQELDNPKIFKEVCGEWQTRLLSAKIAAQTSSSQRENRNSTRKRVLKTNPRDVTNAEGPERLREWQIVTDINSGNAVIKKESFKLSFILPAFSL
jgi:hypothetical protein